MGFAKTLKLWGVYKKTSTVEGFIREARSMSPDTDTVVLRAVWYAFETATEHGQKAPATLVTLTPEASAKVQETVNEVRAQAQKMAKPATKAAPPKRAVATKAAEPSKRYRERLDEPKPAQPRTARKPVKRGRR